MPIPRARQTQDHELLVMGRICDLLATLADDGRRRVIEYLRLRVDTLPTIAVNGGTTTDEDLFAAVPATVE